MKGRMSYKSHVYRVSEIGVVKGRMSYKCHVYRVNAIGEEVW